MRIVYSKDNCIQCLATIQFLEENEISHKVVKIDKDEQALAYVKSLGFMSAPVVVSESQKPFSGFRPDLLSKFI